ncbi:MAG: hypothetical protein KF830_17735 [Planctomycetes bacterium]|nr:hypothetical protein [Planctomycetota bacterium]
MKVQPWCLLLLGACAGNQPEPDGFDSSAGLVTVDVGGDGFVRTDGRRMPAEAAVLALRQRTRAMTAEELGRFVVHLRADRQQAGSEAAAQCQTTINRLVDELVIMGVRQVKFL